jgi:tetratricopeptide (TPR) repeat protein
MIDLMESPLVIFVAMPGSNMGPHAAWKDIPEIKVHLYDPIARQLEAELDVKVDLHIEKDKISQGMIHRSMFNEALQAPVYVADLTGANANVYLELGVRWALRDHVTVLVCQNVAHDVKFNAAANRVIPYGRGPSELEAARRDIVRAIVHGMTSNQVDSPVRENLGVISVSRAELDMLRAQVAKLQEERGDELVAAAESATHDERITLLKRAIQTNPANARAHFLLGNSFVAGGDYAQAVNHLTRATQLNPHDANSWRQLGVAQSRSGEWEKAPSLYRKQSTLTRLTPTPGPSSAGFTDAWHGISSSVRVSTIGRRSVWRVMPTGKLDRSITGTPIRYLTSLDSTSCFPKVTPLRRPRHWNSSELSSTLPGSRPAPKETTIRGSGSTSLTPWLSTARPKKP